MTDIESESPEVIPQAVVVVPKNFVEFLVSFLGGIPSSMFSDPKIASDVVVTRQVLQQALVAENGDSSEVPEASD